MAQLPPATSLEVFAPAWIQNYRTGVQCPQAGHNRTLLYFALRLTLLHTMEVAPDPPRSPLQPAGHPLHPFSPASRRLPEGISLLSSPLATSAASWAGLSLRSSAAASSGRQEQGVALTQPWGEMRAGCECEPVQSLGQPWTARRHTGAAGRAPADTFSLAQRGLRALQQEPAPDTNQHLGRGRDCSSRH